ncbi:hypothetical protein BDV93DRAFT_565394 [Ceratobasidium sp. AG-I]|nr:hypothetical protein BDV93DRAFT_565394 [Ceratobasidium sp. AG-I]
MPIRRDKPSRKEAQLATHRRPQNTQGRVEDSDDDNHGEGPSRPYSADADPQEAESTNELDPSDDECYE